MRSVILLLALLAIVSLGLVNASGEVNDQDVPITLLVVNDTATFDNTSTTNTTTNTTTTTVTSDESEASTSTTARAVGYTAAGFGIIVFGAAVYACGGFNAVSQ